MRMNKTRRRRYKLRAIAIAAYSLLAVLVVFFCLQRYTDLFGSGKTDPANTQTSDSSSNSAINADASTSGISDAETSTTVATQPDPTPTPSIDIDTLKSKLEDYISEQSGKYGVYFINLATGQEFGINDTDEYIAASTSKLPINLFLYRKIESGEVDPDAILTYQKEDFEPGTGIIQGKSFGTQYTVRETSRLSIVYSDNCGINMIIRLLGIDNIQQYMTDLGGQVYYKARHRSCPKDMAIYTKELYRFWLDNPDVVGDLMHDLENTVFKDRIDALLPKDVKVAHKIGNFTNTANDVGIVFAKTPYILSVMSDNVNFDQACGVIAEMSKIVYDFVENEGQ